MLSRVLELPPRETQNAVPLPISVAVGLTAFWGGCYLMWKILQAIGWVMHHVRVVIE